MKCLWAYKDGKGSLTVRFYSMTSCGPLPTCWGITTERGRAPALRRKARFRGKTEKT